MSKSGPPPEVYHPPDYGHHPQYGGPHYGQHHYGPPPPQPGPTYNNTYAPVTSQANNQSTNVVVNMGGAGGGDNLLHARGWSTQLCGCMEDCTGCLYGTFSGFCTCLCFPFMMCMLSARMDEFFLLPLVVPQSLMALRIKIREANNIQGSIFTDCVCTTCCPMLSFCQMKRELDNIDKRKPGTGL